MDNDLNHIALFYGCSSSFLETLSAKKQLRTHKKGKILFIHGDTAERFYYVKSGWVKLFRETLDGTQAVIDILPAGHILGEASIFEGGVYPYSAEIAESAEIISLPLSDLQKEVANNNTLAVNMLKIISGYRRKQDKEIEHRSIQNASQRIGCFLLRLVNQNKDGVIHIHLPYDKTLLASRLGMQPETFSRALAKLRNKTGIRVKGATIEMDNIEQLTDYSCSACTSKFPCKDLQIVD